MPELKDKSYTNRMNLKFMEDPGWRRTFFVTWTVAAIGGIILLVGTYGRTWRFAYYAKITNLSVCSGIDSASGLPIPIEHPITTRTKGLDVCAYLEGLGPIPLVTLWKQGDRFITDRQDYYQPGYITTHLTVPWSGIEPGVHSVMIYEGRHSLGTLEFIVIEEGY